VPFPFPFARLNALQTAVRHSNNVYACYLAGAIGGVVGVLTNACNDVFACYLAGNNGEVGNLTNACNGVYACYSAGDSGGVVGKLKNCCNNGYQVCSGFQDDADFPEECRLTESPTKAPTKSPVKASKTNKLAESPTNPTKSLAATNENLSQNPSGNPIENPTSTSMMSMFE
jgi:hypothetical protein